MRIFDGNRKYKCIPWRVEQALLLSASFLFFSSPSLSPSLSSSSSFLSFLSFLFSPFFFVSSPASLPQNQNDQFSPFCVVSSLPRRQDPRLLEEGYAVHFCPCETLHKKSKRKAETKWNKNGTKMEVMHPSVLSIFLRSIGESPCGII
jgi:hypothetical protein